MQGPQGSVVAVMRPAHKGEASESAETAATIPLSGEQPSQAARCGYHVSALHDAFRLIGTREDRSEPECRALVSFSLVAEGRNCTS